MITKLENDKIKIEIKSKGAELSSFILKEDNSEYLWQGDPKVWGRHAPVLFPIVGGLKNNSYIYENREYYLNKHGFARDKEFSVAESSENTVVYKLKWDEETLKAYPFRFELLIEYTIEGNKVNVGYTVKNLGNKGMYFSIGAHPGFNVPLVLEESFEDYYIEFDSLEEAGTYLVEDGYVTQKKIPFLRNEKLIPLSPELFLNDAIILEELKSSRLWFKGKKTKKEVEFHFGDFKYLGIWSVPVGGNFVCIEPWHGIGDSEEASGELKEKKGILSLLPEEEFGCSHSITVR